MHKKSQCYNQAALRWHVQKQLLQASARSSVTGCLCLFQVEYLNTIYTCFSVYILRMGWFRIHQFTDVFKFMDVSSPGTWERAIR